MDELEPVAWMRVTRGEITHLTHLATLGYEPLVRMSDARAAARERDAMREERDLLEQTIIDASNGAWPSDQGQADPDDATDGLAHWVYARRAARQALNQEQPA